MSIKEFKSTTPEISGYDADELGQYRSLSSLAVVALVLGLCSVLILASPLMVVIPLAAVATALLALKGIAASEGSLTGGSLARWGLVLAVAFGVASYARENIRDMLLLRQADSVAQQWLTLASKGRVEDMLDAMTKDAGQKLMPQAAPGEPSSFFGGMLASALMRHDPLVLSLSELAGEGKLNFRIQESEVVATPKPSQVLLKYRATNASSESEPCSVVLKRYQASANEQVWLVDSWLAN